MYADAQKRKSGRTVLYTGPVLSAARAISGMKTLPSTYWKKVCASLQMQRHNQEKDYSILQGRNGPISKRVENGSRISSDVRRLRSMKRETPTTCISCLSWRPETGIPHLLAQRRWGQFKSAQWGAENSIRSMNKPNTPADLKKAIKTSGVILPVYRACCLPERSCVP